MNSGPSGLRKKSETLPPPAFRQRFANDPLRMADATDRRGIDDGYAAIESSLDRMDRFLIVTPAPHPSADGPCSKRDPRGG
jgi:hypothetical protein